MELTDKLEEQLASMTMVSAIEAKGKTIKQIVSVRRGRQYLVLFTDDTYLTFTATAKRTGDPVVGLGHALWVY